MPFRSLFDTARRSDQITAHLRVEGVIKRNVVFYSQLLLNCNFLH